MLVLKLNCGCGPVVTISDRLWKKRFGGSPDVIGKVVVSVNATPMTIVGVNPPGFTGAYSAQGTPDIFLPFSMQPIVAPQNLDPSWSPSLLTNKDLWWVLVMGRVKPGVPASSAEASLNVTLSAAVRATLPVTSANQIPRLLLRDGSRGQNPNIEEFAKPIYVLIALAGLVLLRPVRSMLYGVAPSDPLTLSGAALLLLLVALGASWIPARRAATVQPMEALRHE